MIEATTKKGRWELDEFGDVFHHHSSSDVAPATRTSARTVTCNVCEERLTNRQGEDAANLIAYLLAFQTAEQHVEEEQRNGETFKDICGHTGAERLARVQRQISGTVWMQADVE